MKKGYLKRIVEVNSKCYKFVGRDYTLMGNFGICLVKWMRLRNTDPELIDKYLYMPDIYRNNYKNLVKVINDLCNDFEPAN